MTRFKLPVFLRLDDWSLLDVNGHFFAGTGNWELVTGNWLLLYTLRMISFKRFSAMLIGSGLAATVTVSAENWPQWRGPGSQGVSPEANVPTEWSSTKNVAFFTSH